MKNGKPRRAAKKAKPAPDLEPELVAEVYQLPTEFPFPGKPDLAPVPVSLADLAETIRARAGTIENPRMEGMAEWAAGRLAVSLVEWLAGRSAEGSRDAQASLVELSDTAVQWYLWSLREGHEVTTKRARMVPDIPGRMSLNPEVSAHWQEFLEGIRQGAETLVPMKRTPGATKSKRNVTLAQHRLVSALHDFMEGYRHNGNARLLKIPPDHAGIPKLGRDILSLPPFGKATFPEWHRVGLKIVKHYTKGNPRTHEAFARHPLRDLNPSGKDPGGRNARRIPQDLRAGWKALAMSKSALDGGV